jgi:hypothetical protein
MYASTPNGTVFANSSKSEEIQVQTFTRHLEDPDFMEILQSLLKESAL